MVLLFDEALGLLTILNGSTSWACWAMLTLWTWLRLRYALQRYPLINPPHTVTLHIIHLYVLAVGGAQDMRNMLGRMAWQVMELGLHRAVTARNYPAGDRVDRLFFMTLYKDR